MRPEVRGTVRRLWALAIGALLACAALPAHAADSSGWTVTIGAKAGVFPDYEGSNRYIFRPLPLFDVRPAGTPPRFSSPRESITLGVVEQNGFRAGIAGKLRFPRREGDDPDLRGLGDVDWGAELGGFAEYWPVQWLRAHAELRQGVGAHHGLVSDVLVDAVWPVTPMLTLSGGPRLTAQSQKAVSPYFDVTAAQSAASGLPIYSTRGGITSWGMGGQARYEWSPQWATYVYVEYQRLVGDVANAPIVALRGSRDQFESGLGVTYSFNMPSLW
jgi:MipA family protein